MLDPLLALGHVVVGKVGVKLGLRRRPDGWRRIVGVGLRNEASKFAVAAFGLTPPPGNLAAALARFLRTEPDAHFALTHAARLTGRRPADRVDVVELRFAGDALAAIEPAGDAGPVVAAVVSAYNRTRTAPEAVRAIELERLARAKLPPADWPRLERLLSAACVVVEAGDPSTRFAPPEFRARRGLGFGHLTFTVRVFGEAVDVWALAHHTGIDGAALQEMVGRLRAAWPGDAVAFPDPHDLPIEPRRCSCGGEREVFESLTFHEFGPLLALRKRLNVGLAGDGVTVGSLLMWLLAGEPEFRRVKFGSTVDVPPRGDSERDVDMVALRPGDWGEVGSFADAYRRAVDAARARTSPTRAEISTAELLPPGLQRRLLEANPDRVNDTFGAVGLSILRDAPVFVAPYSDTGFPGGFVAVGDINLPTATGRRVGAVSVKGDRTAAATYPEVLRRVLAKLAATEPAAA